MIIATFAKILFPTAILVFFSQEFRRIFEKLFKIPGMKLFLPLIFFTMFLMHFEAQFSLALIWIKFLLFYILSCMVKTLNFQFGLAKFLLVTIFICLSIVMMERRKKKRAFLVYKSDWVLHFVIWALIVWEISSII